MSSTDREDEARQARLRRVAAELDPLVVEYVDDSVDDALDEIRRRMDRLGVQHERAIARVERRLRRVVAQVSGILVKLKTICQHVGIKSRKSRDTAR